MFHTTLWQWLTLWLESKALAFALAMLYIVVLSAVLHWLFNKLTHKLEKQPPHEMLWLTQHQWLQVVRTPAISMLWVFFTHLALWELARFTQAVPAKYVGTSLTLTTLIIIAWFTLNTLNALEQRLRLNIKHKKSRLDLTTASAIVTIIRITLLISFTLIGLDSLGFSISALIALGSASGFGISFAARDMLANYFGAVMIYLDRPFKVGEDIRIPERNLEGKVEVIGLRATMICTINKRPLYIPNSLFSNIAIENISRMSHRHINERILLQHADLHLIPNALSEIKQVIASHRDIDDKEVIIVEIENIMVEGVTVYVYCFSKLTSLAEYAMVRGAVLQLVTEILLKHHIRLQSIQRISA